jgi:hypothetical protein
VKFFALQTCLWQDLFSSKEWSVNYAVEELLMKEANETLLPVGSIMKRLGKCLFDLAFKDRGPAGIDRDRLVRVAVGRAECDRMNNARKQHERQQSRNKCAGWS